MAAVNFKGAVCGLWLYSALPCNALERLDDEALSGVAGQSLFNSLYTASGGSNPNGNVAFYRLMVDAQLDLNMNIHKLALGCDGPNGTGVCDIDIDRVVLTGLAGTGVDAGPPTDFTLYRPFLEFAISNPDSPSTRTVTGIRLGAAEAFGNMSLGFRPAGTDNNPANHSGINSFSGDMVAMVNNAQLPVSLCLLSAANATRTGCNFGGGIPLGNATINTDDPNPGDNVFNLVLRRQGINANSPTLSPVVAVAVGFLSLHADFTEDLRFVHSLQMGSDTNGNGRFDAGEGTRDFYLGLQKLALTWPKVSTGNFAGAVPAEKGWWMSVPKVILGDFTGRRVYAGAGEAIGNLLGGANVPISNVDLNQRPVDNCWGTLTFC